MAGEYPRHSWGTPPPPAQHLQLLCPLVGGPSGVNGEEQAPHALQDLVHVLRQTGLAGGFPIGQVDLSRARVYLGVVHFVVKGDALGGGRDRGRGDVTKVWSPTGISSLTGGVPSGNSFGICTENLKMPPLYMPCRTKTTPTHSAERAIQHAPSALATWSAGGSPNGLREGTTYTPGGQQRRSRLLKSRNTQHSLQTI